MDFSLRGLVHTHYDDILDGFSVIKDVLSKARLDIGEQAYRTPDGSISLRRLFSGLESTQPVHIPQKHRSPEAEIDRHPCCDHITGGFWTRTVRTFTWGIWDPVNKMVDVSPLLPEWVPVESENPVILEGEVVAGNGSYPSPHVAFEDLPISHYTHDFCFKVRPNPTPDNRYTNLLGTQVYDLIEDPCGAATPLTPTPDTTQDLIEVEWESGLGASNDGNPLSDANKRGDSGGFFSAGHRRRENIWNWPTLGDWVHVEGRWIWDRGHPPAQTEIHPPRLVAIRRELPTTQTLQPDRVVLATQVDIFASGDGGAFQNNRPGVPPFVKRTSMSDRDYSFAIAHLLPRPSPNAILRWDIISHPGDTFPGNPNISIVTVALPSDTQHGELTPGIRVMLPWKTSQAPDDAVFARTIKLYWDEGRGVPPDYGIRVFRVTLDNVLVVNSHDPVGDGEYRLFVEVGGNWFFVNEAPGDDDILNDGLGDTGDNEIWHITRQFTVYVPPGGSFRVHAGGWEADGVNDVFGKLIDDNTPCSDLLKNWLNDNLFCEDVFFNGGMDDPIGEINSVFNEANGFGVGNPHEDSSSGPIKTDDPTGDTDPNDSYRLRYRIDELSWP